MGPLRPQVWEIWDGVAAHVLRISGWTACHTMALQTWRVQHWWLRLMCSHACAPAPSYCADEPGRPISRYQDWTRSVKLPREGGYRWLETRLHGHHRRKSDSTREQPAASCACSGGTAADELGLPFTFPLLTILSAVPPCMTEGWRMSWDHPAPTPCSQYHCCANQPCMTEGWRMGGGHPDPTPCSQ